MIRAFLKTYGCQANVADSLDIEKYLSGLACQVVTDESNADLIIVNTCAIREKAEQKIFSYLGGLAAHKKDRPHIICIVIGCIASYRKKELIHRFPHIDTVFSAKDDLSTFKNQLGDIIESIGTKKALYSSEDQTFKRSMINIMRGCNNYCSYCIVPFTTGRERSFPMEGILSQIKRDIADGAKEITLLGQNVNSYADPETGSRFEILLEKASKLDGNFWIRFVSPHPKDMTSELIDTVARYPEKLCSFIHLPLQSGSNKILKAMNRTYTVEKYLDLVDEIKLKLPNVTLTTDIIVGFPGEDEEDYLATRAVIEKVKYSTIFSFTYSPRKYTKAAEMADSTPQTVKLMRLRDLQKRQREIGTEKNRELIGKEVKILTEGFSGRYWGRTEGNIKVFLSDKEVPNNSFLNVKIIDAQLSDLTGMLIKR